MKLAVSPLRLPSLALAAGLAAAALAPAQTGPSAEQIFNVGLVHLRENRPGVALEEFKKAIKEDPKNPYFHKGLGLAYAQLRKFPDAVAAFRKALELNPYYVDVRNDLGTALVLMGKRDEAKVEFMAAYNDATNPTPELAARNLGQAYLEEKNYAEAANWFRSTLNRNKSYPDAYVGLSEALMGLSQPEEALPVLEQGLKQVPDSVPLIAALGEAYFRAGRFSDARARLEDVARRDPAGPAGRKAQELLKNFPK